MSRTTVTFPNNVPVELSLAYPEGKIISGRYGDRATSSLDVPAQHVMFVDLGVSKKFNLLEFQPGEQFFICGRPKNESVPPRWDIWLSPATEQQRAAKQMQEAELQSCRPL